MKWFDTKTRSFAERLFAFACVEGIFFSGSFCAIYWLKKERSHARSLLSVMNSSPGMKVFTKSLPSNFSNYS